MNLGGGAAKNDGGGWGKGKSIKVGLIKETTKVPSKYREDGRIDRDHGDSS